MQTFSFINIDSAAVYEHFYLPLNITIEIFFISIKSLKISTFLRMLYHEFHFFWKCLIAWDHYFCWKSFFCSSENIILLRKRVYFFIEFNFSCLSFSFAIIPLFSIWLKFELYFLYFQMFFCVYLNVKFYSITIICFMTRKQNLHSSLKISEPLIHQNKSNHQKYCSKK